MRKKKTKLFNIFGWDQFSMHGWWWLWIRLLSTTVENSNFIYPMQRTTFYAMHGISIVFSAAQHTHISAHHQTNNTENIFPSGLLLRQFQLIYAQFSSHSISTIACHRFVFERRARVVWQLFPVNCSMLIMSQYFICFSFSLIRTQSGHSLWCVCELC